MGSQTPQVKFLIPLAAFLLVPIVAKFQTRDILEKSNPRSLELVREVLAQNNVSNPQASLEYLDLSIAGLVTTEEQAATVAREVEQLPGLRLAQNRLAIQGWLKITRQQDRFAAQGLVPEGWPNELFRGQPKLNQEELRSRDLIEMAGGNAVAWGLLIDGFFDSEGDRHLILQGDQLTLGGEATPSQSLGFKALKDKLGDEIQLTSDYRLRPSLFHFRSRDPESPIEGEPLRSLRQRLANSPVSFLGQTAELSPQGITSLNDLAALVTQSKAGAQFVLGCHPSSSTDPLADQRARTAREHLLASGVPRERVVIVPFEMTEVESGSRGQVELLLR